MYIYTYKIKIGKYEKPDSLSAWRGFIHRTRSTIVCYKFEWCCTTPQSGTCRVYINCISPYPYALISLYHNINIYIYICSYFIVIAILFYVFYCLITVYCIFTTTIFKQYIFVRSR